MEKKTKALAAIAAGALAIGIALSVASCALRSAGTDFFVCVIIALPICTARAAENVAIAPVRRSAIACGVFCLAERFALHNILLAGAYDLSGRNLLIAGSDR